MIIGDIDTFDPDKIANRFYILFSRNWSKTEIFNSKYFKRFSCQYSKRILKYSAKSKTSLKRGDISPSVVNVISKNIFSLITHISNFCLQQGIVRNSFKMASVTSIFKKVEEELLTNHRPISIILHLSYSSFSTPILNK